MIEFIQETLLLLPFLFVTYLVLEAVEAHASGALGRFLERSRSLGPLAGGLAGLIPQCGVSAAAASFFAGGVISVGTLLAVFLATSDELIPVLLSMPGFSKALLLKIALLKVGVAILVGFSVNGILVFMRRFRREVSVSELCAHSHCSCHEHKGIVIPALIHTAEIFFFIVLISGAVELTLHYLGTGVFQRLCLTKPFLGELVSGVFGLIPNCAISVAQAQLYANGVMSAGALMAGSFTSSGLGLLVLFRTNRDWRENLMVLASVYVYGWFFGWLSGILFF